MLLVLALLSAFACACCYGVSSVLQKAGADRQKEATSLDPRFFLRLLGNLPYVLGTFLDLAAWPLTLVAAHYLPLFVVEPIVALSVVMTLLVEAIFLKRKVSRQLFGSMVVVLAGLALITSQATVQTAEPVSRLYYWGIVLAPVGLALIGSAAIRSRGRIATVMTALVAGAAFGLAAVPSRLLIYPHPFWMVIKEPLLYAIPAYGGLGIMLFSIALQRARASVVNAYVVTTEVMAPLTAGLLILGDRPKHNAYGVILLGALISLTGTVLVSLNQNSKK